MPVMYANLISCPPHEINRGESFKILPASRKDMDIVATLIESRFKRYLLFINDKDHGEHKVDDDKRKAKMMQSLDL